MRRVKAEKRFYSVFIVLTFDKTTTLPTHAKNQFGHLKFILESEAWCDKKRNVFTSESQDYYFFYFPKH